MLEKDRISYFYDGTFAALPVPLFALTNTLQNPSSRRRRSSQFLFLFGCRTARGQL
jgi:hypothetical protein